LRQVFADEAMLLKKIVLSWQLWAVVLFSAIVLLAAYQNRETYRIDIGGQSDLPFVTGFFAKEHNDQLNYRWSKDSSEIVLPGIGSPGDLLIDLQMNAWRPAGTPPPFVTVLANGTELGTVQPTGELKSYRFVVSREVLGAGSLYITLHSQTFLPAGDQRTLGVLLDSVSVSPMPEAAGRLVRPGMPEYFWLILASGILFVWLRQILIPAKWAMAIAGASAVGLAYLVAFQRLGTTIFAGQLAMLLVIAFLLSLLVQLAGGSLAAAGKLKLSPGELAALSGVFALAFIVRYGGMIYPQFISSDLGMHAHRLEMVLNGNLFFTNPLPDGREAPYPPAYYILLAPLGYLWSDHQGLLKLSSSLLDASSVLIMAYILRKANFGGIAPAVSGLVYAFTPYLFMVLSWGNHTNVFGEWAGLLLLAALISLVGGTGKLGFPLAAVGVLAALTFTSHYGSLLVSLLAVAVLLALAILLASPEGRKRAVFGGITIGLALAAVYLLYYSHFSTLIASQAANVAGSGGSSAATDVLTRLAKLGKSDLGLLGYLSPVLLFGGIGLAVVNRGKRSAFAIGLAGWTLAAIGFGIFGRVVGMETRHELLLAPIVAMGAGILLSKLDWRRLASRAFVVVLLGFVAWQGLAVWFDRIMYAYH
jgi:hypothetical protein